MLEKVVKKFDNSLRSLSFLGIMGFGLVSGCSVIGIPKTRIGCFPTGWPNGNYPNPNNLGIHNRTEKNGLVYACEAGLIDLYHMRNGVDRTKFYFDKSFNNLMNNKTEFSFKATEPSVYNVKINYPENWKSLNDLEKKAIAKEVAIDCGAYFSYISTTWHEILTSFDYKFLGFISQFESAFTFEDNFSNLLGVYLGEKALHKGGDFNKTVSLLIDEELRKLGVQSSQTAKYVSKNSTLKKRHLDIGLNGDMVPWIFEIKECEGAEPKSYSVPSSDLRYGFSIELEIEPKICGEIQRIVGKNKINPKIDFPIIMKNIEKKMIKKFGSEAIKL